MRELNLEQKKAIENINGKICVYAGAGTGKTTVLVEGYLARLNELKKEMDLSEALKSILAVTFTREAARKMREAIEERLKEDGYSQLWKINKNLKISTIDSFCNSVLVENALFLGIDPEFLVIDEVASKLLFKECALHFFEKEFRPLDLQESLDKFLYQCFEFINNLRYRNIRPDENGEILAELSNSDLSNEEKNELEIIIGLYKNYEQYLRDHNFFDYPRLLLEVIDLWEKNPQLLDNYRKQYKYIMVDEYQDTSKLQDLLLRKLSEPEGNYFVVGDIYQSIYGWRGAQPEHIRNFKEECKIDGINVVLSQNYRSLPSILELVNFAFEEEKSNGYHEIFSQRKEEIEEGKKEFANEIFFAKDKKKEGEFVAKRIKSLLDSNKDYSPKDFFILLRNPRNVSGYFEEPLRKLEIPVVTISGTGFYKRREIKDIISLLKIVNNPYDDLYMLRVLKMPIYNISSQTLAALKGDFQQGKFKIKNHSFYQGLKELENLDLVNEEKERLLKLREFLEMFIIEKKRISYSALIEKILKESGYLKYIQSLSPSETERSIANLRKFYEIAASFREKEIFAGLSYFINYIEEAINLDITESEAPLYEQIEAVQIMSIHQAKGLEAKVVFLSNISERNFPSNVKNGRYFFENGHFYLKNSERFKKEVEKENKIKQMEEELRLLYVGMTRAKDKLILTGCYSQGKNKKKQISRYMKKFVQQENFSLYPQINGKIFFWEGINHLQPLNKYKTKEKEIQRLDEKKIIQRIKSTYTSWKEQKSNIYTVSQLATYKLCPLKYKFRYLLEIPGDPGIYKEETEDDGLEYGLFGSAVHLLLEEYLRDKKRGKNWDKEELRRRFNQLALNFGISQGSFINKFKSASDRIIDNFLGNKYDTQEFVLLEEPFTLIIEGNPVKGVIDRVDRKGLFYEIIDYKTNRSKSLRRYLFPLQVYAYALENIFKFPVNKITLLYLWLNEEENVNLNKNIEEELKDIIIQIQEGNFTCLPSDECQYCEYKLICQK